MMWGEQESKYDKGQWLNFFYNAPEILMLLGGIIFLVTIVHSFRLRVFAALSEAGLISSGRDRLDGRWIYYTIEPETAVQWQQWFREFFDPERLQKRVLCGREGQANFVLTADLSIEM